MSVAGFVKRAIVGVVGLTLLIGFALTSMYHYVDRNPEAQERLELSAKRAELSANDDDGFWTKVGLLFAAWWDSDDLIADAREEKAERDKSVAERKQRDAASGFERGDTYYSNDDYYGRRN